MHGHRGQTTRLLTTGNDVVEALASVAPTAPGEAVVPSAAGFYAWWTTTETLADAEPAIAAVRPSKHGWCLLYVGIAPRAPGRGTPQRTSSTRTLSDRLVSDHRGGNIGGSTFRYSLASLLIAHLGLAPRKGHDRARLTDEGPLTAWIERYCGLTIAERERPWEVEDAVIRQLNPPLNLRPGYHEFRHAVIARRRSLDRACGL